MIIENQEKIYTANWTLGYDNPRSDSKEFKTAVEAYKFLKKKIRRYKNTTYWHHYITVGGWDGTWIYEEGECGEKTTDPEIQALMDAADHEAEIKMGADEAKHFLNFILANYNITLDELCNFLVEFYEKTGTYFEYAGGRSAMKTLTDWINARTVTDYAVSNVFVKKESPLFSEPTLYHKNNCQTNRIGELYTMATNFSIPQNVNAIPATVISQADFNPNFIIKGDNCNYRLVKLNDNYCELDIIKNTTEAQKLNFENLPTEIRTSRRFFLVDESKRPLQKDWRNKNIRGQRLILLNRAPYSNIPAKRLNLRDAEWLELSHILRLRHECAHYETLRIFGSMKNHALDEILADATGQLAAFGNFSSARQKLFSACRGISARGV